MSVNWLGINGKVDGCDNVKEIEELLVKNGVKDVFRVLVSSVRSYSYGRDFRNKSNVGVKEVKRENKEMRDLIVKLERKLKEVGGLK